MSENTTAPASAATAMAPVRPPKRIEIVDILRGLAVLGILLFNMMSFSGSLHTPLQQMTPIHRAATLFIKFVAQAKFYTLFSFLFGWGMSIQMERAASRGARFAPLYLRRLFTLLLIGLAHAILIWDGDILVIYALLGLPLLLFRKLSEKAILVAAVVCILIPVLISAPIEPIEAFLQAYTQAADHLYQATMAGYQANVYVEGTYLEATLHRWNESIYGYTQFIYWATHIFGMFLLGLYVGRRKILHHASEHLPLFRRVLVIGLIVGLPLNLLFVAVTHSPGLVPADYFALATRGARTIAGSVLSMVYASAIVLLAQKQEWRNRLAPLASVGRMALSNYLSHSIFCTLIFYGYGLGLYGRFGPAITLILTLIIYRAQVSLSGWWLFHYRFGLAEWLWRTLTYFKLQPLKPERARASQFEQALKHSAKQAIAPIQETDAKGDALEPSPPADWLIFMLRRLAFIAVVAFAIVYFCALGLNLTANSTAPVNSPRNALDMVEPAFEETIEFFGDALNGDLGYVIQGVTQRTQVPVMELLAATFTQSASLLAVSIGVAAVIGVMAGGVAATRRHSAISLSTLTLTIVGVSIPSFFLALLFQVADIRFYQNTGMGLFPVYGISGHRTASLLPQVVAPALVLAARPLAHITRVTFVSISEILNRDYIRTARAKGLGPSVVYWRHTLRNAGVSIFTAVVISLRFALGSLPVVEIFFQWPGMGITMYNAINARDTTVVTVLALALGVTFLLVSLLADLLYRLIDPRLRMQTNGGGS
jgi:uncharacterized protein